MNLQYAVIFVVAIFVGIGSALYMNHANNNPAATTSSPSEKGMHHPIETVPFNAPWQEKYQDCKMIAALVQKDPKMQNTPFGNIFGGIDAKCEKGRAACEGDQNGEECHKFMDSITKPK